jgi:glycosyltransferase involved in cell wall biosynthesis
VKIQIFDIIGIKSGMDYYLISFFNLLKKNKINTSIKSNFIHENELFFPNIYKGNLVVKIFKLFYSFVKFFYSIQKKDTKSVILFYGTYIDALFLSLCFLNKNVFIDVHEVILLDNKSNLLRKIIIFFLKNSKNTIIYHSKRTKETIREIGFNGEAIYVPHFRYEIKKDYNLEFIGGEIYNLISSSKKNFLFFGNIRKSKGIEELLQVINYLNTKDSGLDELNIIIAGADIFNIVKNKEIIYNSFTKILLRQLNDSEMKYLFSKSDIILLPYSNITQSGVLEMAIHFEKPILTSNLKYFKNILNQFPSFGLNIDTTNVREFSNKIIELSQKSEMIVLKKDIETYYSEKEYNLFITNFKSKLI